MTIKSFWIIAVLLIAGITATKAQAISTATAADSVAAIVGKWTGTYTGDDAGNFELVINRDNGGKLTGQIIMLPADGSRYPIDLKTVTWSNKQLKASYADPSNNNPVTFGGTYDGTVMKGNWEANSGQATGTFQVTKASR